MKIAPTRIAKLILKMVGWTYQAKSEDANKFVLIASPHTSNWDGFYMLVICAAMNQDIQWIVKDNIFKPPFSWILKKLGGIPVDRSKRSHFTTQIAKIFAENEQLAIAIAPEGTRSRREYWRTGFYYMALEAKVPIAFGFLDYENKRGGIGPLLYPTGDIEADFEKIREFYKDIVGRKPENNNPIALKKSGD